MSEPRIIKRYANRKLYDTQYSRYVTLEQIAEMIRGGEDVSIVDNNSKDDLTSVTLAQIIFEEEKRKNSFLPLASMRHIIQSGEESIHELAAQAGAGLREMTDGATHAVREFIERSQQTFDEWQKRVDERARHVVETLAPWTLLEKELHELDERLADLEKRLDHHNNQ